MKDKLVNRILSIVNLNIENIEITDQQMSVDLMQLGMDSISFIKIIVMLEDEFDCEIPDENLSLGQLNTCDKIYEIISTILIQKDAVSTT